MPGRFSLRDLVVAGKVIKPHGVLGWVKVQVLSSNPGRFAVGNSFILEGREATDRLVIQRVKRTSGDAILVKFEGMETRDQAELIRGRRLFITPDEVGEPPPGCYWEHQIVGLEVITTEGLGLGKVREVMETGANDVLVVRQGSKERLIPMIEDVVKEVDLERKVLVIFPMPGLLED
ncbi:MAG: ribosome maturation factor RimM [Candidatus Geothermincolales bacterium]